MKYRPFHEVSTSSRVANLVFLCINLSAASRILHFCNVIVDGHPKLLAPKKIFILNYVMSEL